MFRPNGWSSPGTTNCIKYKRDYIKIALSELRYQFYKILFSCCISGMVRIKTVVKIVRNGNIDVVLMMVKWVIQCFVASLCGVSKNSFPVERDVCVLKVGWAARLCPENLLTKNSLSIFKNICSCPTLPWPWSLVLLLLWSDGEDYMTASWLDGRQ
jgi:hypothetical protein